jgi:putrescine transport system permease protein
MARGASQGRSLSGALIRALTFAWLVVFVLVPLVIVLKISLSDVAPTQPPYAPQLDLGAGWAGLREFFAGLSSRNYADHDQADLYLWSLRNSLQFAAVSTLILVLIGYPFAYGIARAPKRLQAFLVALVILPFWTSSVVRIYAWQNVLDPEGLLNKALSALGLIHEPIIWYPSDGAAILGIVYTYLPFMVLPIFAVLEGMDETLLEAAADLGCPPTRSFWRVTLPLSASGVVAGAMLCFIPIIGEYVIPSLLGRDETMMSGQILWTYFETQDWPLSSAIAMAMLAVLLVPMVLYQRFDAIRRARVS